MCAHKISPHFSSSSSSVAQIRKKISVLFVMRFLLFLCQYTSRVFFLVLKKIVFHFRSDRIFFYLQCPLLYVLVDWLVGLVVQRWKICLSYFISILSFFAFLILFFNMKQVSKSIKVLQKKRKQTHVHFFLNNTHSPTLEKWIYFVLSLFYYYLLERREKGRGKKKRRISISK